MRVSAHPRRHRRATGTRTRLIGLVLIPTVGFGIPVATELGNRRDTAVQAEAVARDVEASVEALELVVALSRENRVEELVVQSGRFGVSPEAAGELLGFDLATELRAARRAVDRAPGLDSLLEGIGGREALARARAVVNAGTRAETAPLFLEITDAARVRWSTLLERVDATEHVAGSADMLNALIALRVGAMVSNTAQEQLVAAAERLIPELDADGTQDLDVLRSVYELTVRELQAYADDHVRAEIDAVVGDREFAELAATLPEAARPGQPIDVDRLASIFRLGLERDARLRDLIDALSQDAHAHAVVVGDAARDGFNRLLAAVVAGAAAVVALAAYVARSISRPLARLEQRARELSGGDVSGEPLPLSGPRETAVVAESLNEAVGNLRALERKASALASGDLAAVDADPIPGKLSDLLNRSVQALARAITERERLQRRLEYDASHDTLTGLANRRVALGSLEQLLAERERTVAALCIDVDGFKHVNDQLGHTAGDTVLRYVASRLDQVAPPDAVVARLGGDEFLVATTVAGQDQAMALAEQLGASLNGPVLVEGVQRRVAVSVGVALSGPNENADRLLRWADVALFEAKRGSRGRAVVLDDELRRTLEDQHELEGELRAAIADDALEVHYQPVVEAASGRMVAVEALVRWRRDGTLVPPDLFIPTAERSDLVVELDRAVLRRAAAQLAAWRTGPFPHLRLWFNFSARTLLSPRIVGHMAETLTRTGLPSGAVGVEVTETTMLHDIETAAERLQQLRELGVATAIDDFGTGYTSVSQLRGLPVDEVKIDRSFIDRMDDERERALVDMVLRIGHVLGIDVVAEGVETEHQLEQLRELGCGLVQGYLLGRPVTAADLEVQRADEREQPAAVS